MTRLRLLSGLCLFLLATGCERKPQTRLSDPDPPVPGRARPAPVKPEAMTPPPDAGPAPGARSLPRPTPLGKEAFLPTVAPPTWKDLQPLVKVAGLRAPVASSQIVAIGGVRFAAVARMTEKSYGYGNPETGPKPGEYALVLILVEPAAGGWKVTESKRIFDFNFNGFPGGTDNAPARITPGDLDHDGRPELEVRIRATQNERAVGAVERSHVLLLALGTPLRYVLYEVTDARAGSYRVTSTLRYVDLSGDGFPDVHLVEQTRGTEPGPGEDIFRKREERRYLYDPVSDGYLRDGKRMRPLLPASNHDRGDPDWRDPNEP
jgi:hypothetical protein